MLPNLLIHYQKKKITLIFFITLLIVISYSNTLDCSWHLDDFANIVNNNKLHLNDLKVTSLINCFFARPSEDNQQYQFDQDTTVKKTTGVNKFYRPVSCLTLGMNWYFSNDNVTLYHVTNIIFHILTAIILFFTILLLFETPKIVGKYEENKLFIAFFSTILWALNPIQTQAITYIVQRMALLATMFYILSIFFYIKGRLCLKKNMSLLFYFLCFISFLLSIGSKENTAILPFTLLLIEFCFFQSIDLKNKINLAIILFTVVLFISIAGFIIRWDTNIFFKGYSSRDFTLIERLLTESRVIMLYLSLIFYPVSSRFSIQHDIIISKNLFYPITTLFSIIAIFIIVGISLYKIKKKPLIAFAILFYFINHIIESTILPLELIFEHRNYLPSLFLFLPVSIILKKGMDLFKTKTKIYKWMYVFIVFLIFMFSMGTYTRNMVWKDELTLWKDAILTAPKSLRAYGMLGVTLLDEGKIGEAVHYFMKIYVDTLIKEGTFESMRSFIEASDNDLPPHQVFYRRGLVLESVNGFSQAIQQYNIALAIEPNYFDAHNHIASIYSRYNHTSKALIHFYECIRIRPDLICSYQNLSMFMISQGRFQDAIKYLNEALKIDPYNALSYANWGVFYLKQKKFNDAYIYLNKALELDSNLNIAKENLKIIQSKIK
ncbi:MAG: hypothetical protein HQK76_05190 [Desulfobacterales bacterium]|nr:hypothetical protein [Desulfobacterales bacterium]